MRIFKEITAIIMAGAMCMGLCGCSTDLDTMLLMKKVYDSAEKTKSAEGDFECKAEGKYGIIPLKLNMEGDWEYTAEKPTIKLDAEIGLGILGDIDAEVYIRVNENIVELYAGVEKLGEGMNWIQSRAEIPEGTSPDVKGFVNMIDKGSVLVTRGEEKQISGVKAVKLTLTLPGDMIGVALGNQSCVVGDIVIDAWVNKSSGRIMKIESELSELAKLIISTAMEEDADSIKITSMPLTVEFEEFDTVEKIVIPEEALKIKGTKAA